MVQSGRVGGAAEKQTNILIQAEPGYNDEVRIPYHPKTERIK